MVAMSNEVGRSDYRLSLLLGRRFALRETRKQPRSGC